VATLLKYRLLQESVMQVKSNSSKLALLAIMLISASISILRLDTMQVGGSMDDAQYIILAESLVSGQGYRLINFPEPSTSVSFPPGWPLIVAIFTKLSPGNYTILKMVSLLLWLATIPLIYRFFSSRIRSPFLEILTFLVAINALLVAASTMLMAEAAYIFFSLLTLNLFDYWYERNKGEMKWLIPVVAFTAVYTQLIRSVGFSIVLAILVYLMLARKFQKLVIMTSFVIVGLLPQIFLYSSRGGGLFSGHYQSLSVGTFSVLGTMVQVLEQALGYANLLITNSIIPIFRPSVVSILQGAGMGFLVHLFNVIILTMIAIGFLRSLRGFKIWEVYVIFYFGAILIFRDPTMGIVQPRFLVPLIPFFYYYLIEGSAWLIRHILVLKVRQLQYVLVTFTFIIALISLLDNFQSWQNPARLRTTDLSVGTTWIRQTAPSDAVIMTRDPIPRFLYARRATVYYPSKEQDLEAYIRDLGVDYILVAPILKTPRDNTLDQYTRLQLLPYLTANSERFKVVFANPEHNVQVYEVRSDE
jgi:hypothetical protein